MILKAMSRGASTENLSYFGPEVWAVGGGAIDFGCGTRCNSGTSVQRSIHGIHKCPTGYDLVSLKEDRFSLLQNRR